LLPPHLTGALAPLASPRIRIVPSQPLLNPLKLPAARLSSSRALEHSILVASHCHVPPLRSITETQRPWIGAYRGATPLQTGSLSARERHFPPLSRPCSRTTSNIRPRHPTSDANHHDALDRADERPGLDEPARIEALAISRVGCLSSSIPSCGLSIWESRGGSVNAASAHESMGQWPRQTWEE
jgi:hypothetical protein